MNEMDMEQCHHLKTPSLTLTSSWGEIERRGLNSLLQEDDIVPTPYGTIDLDFRSDLGLVSVEIGDDGVGYFTEFPGDRENLSQEELPLGSEEIYTIIQSLK